MTKLANVSARVNAVGLAARKLLTPQVFDTVENPTRALADRLRQPLRDEINRLEVLVAELQKENARLKATANPKDMVEKERVRSLIQEVAAEYGHEEELEGRIIDKLRFLVQLGFTLEKESDGFEDEDEHEENAGGSEQAIPEQEAMSEEEISEFDPEPAPAKQQSSEESDFDVQAPSPAPAQIAAVIKDDKVVPVAFVAPDEDEQLDRDLDRLLENIFPAGSEKEKQEVPVQKSEAASVEEETNEFEAPALKQKQPERKVAEVQETATSRFIERMNAVRNANPMNNAPRFVIRRPQQGR